MDEKWIREKQITAAKEFLYAITYAPRALITKDFIQAEVIRFLLAVARLGEVYDEILVAPVDVAREAFKAGRIRLAPGTYYPSAKILGVVGLSSHRPVDEPSLYYTRFWSLTDSIDPHYDRHGNITGCRITYSNPLNGRRGDFICEFPFVKYFITNRVNAQQALWNKESIFSGIPLDSKKLIVQELFVARVGEDVPAFV